MKVSLEYVEWLFDLAFFFDPVSRCSFLIYYFRVVLGFSLVYLFGACAPERRGARGLTRDAEVAPD